ncbi:MAG: PilN domain-containing protein [Acidobacteriota bacterium]
MIKLNLLTKAEKLPKKRVKVKREKLREAEKPRILLLILVLILSFGFISYSYIWINDGIKNEKAQLENLKKKKKELEQIIKDLKNYQNIKNELQMKINIVKEIKAGQKVPILLMYQLSKNLPDLVWLKELRFFNGKLTISGSAFSNTLIADFIRNLDYSGYFKNINLKETSKKTVSGGNEIFDFSLESEFLRE